MRIHHLLAAVLLLPGGATGQSQGAPAADSFFADDSVAVVTLTLPMGFIRRERSVEEQASARFEIDANTYDIKVRARGNFRRSEDVCDFPPVRLNFKKSETNGTPLHGIDKVKLVTHCNSGVKHYERTVVREFLAYKILNILTDTSFRARLLRITYVDSDGKRKKQENFAVMLEHRDQLAARIGGRPVEMVRTAASVLDRDYTNLVSVFQYLIGNTDYSPVVARDGEPCCHNAELFFDAGERLHAIPYDFDHSGLVNARHARPNPRFRIRKVTQRVYRGRCINNDILQQTLDYVNSRQEEILNMIETIEGPDDATRKEAAKYVKSFYKIALNPKSVQRYMANACI